MRPKISTYLTTFYLNPDTESEKVEYLLKDKKSSTAVALFVRRSVTGCLAFGRGASENVGFDDSIPYEVKSEVPM